METNAGGSEAGGLRRRFLRHLRDHPELIPPGTRAVVAVSGGPDSMALLDLLARSGTTSRIVAAHFDHGLRPASAEEARRVVEWCRRREIPWAAGGPSVPLSPDPAACRRARYRFLQAVAEGAGAGRVVTAHHADDQAETVLFRILRGTDLAGLRGVRRLDGRVCRPLLPFRKEELVAYARRRDLPCHEDPSNRDPGYARSRVRHRLLPALRARDDSIGQSLCRLARRAEEAEASMASVTGSVLAACRMPWAEADGGDAVRLSRTRLGRLPPELQARVIRRVAGNRGVRLTRGGIRSAVEFIGAGRSGGRVDLGGGLRLGRDFDFFWVGRDGSAPEDDRPVTFRLPGSGRARARIGGSGYGVAWGRGDPGGSAPGGRLLRLASPPKPRQLELCVRGWEPGDRVRLTAGSRKLQDVFVDRRVPRSLRRRMPVVARARRPGSGPGADGRDRADRERVIWVPGLCRSSEPEDSEPRTASRAEECWVIISGAGQLAPGAP